MNSAEDRLDVIEEQMARVFSRLENIEHVLGIRPSGMHPLHSETMEGILGRLYDLEAKVEIE